jgi:chromate transporter
LEIAGAFLKLGCTSFGGPVAHLGYLHAEFVIRRRWLDEAAYAERVALCNFLPGPSSSQLVFALGFDRGGLPGALLASLLFTLPSAILMILFAYGVTAVGELQHAGWLRGLKVAAVAVVAQAVWVLGRRLCPDPVRIALALASAASVVIIAGTFAQVAAIAVGALVGWAVYRRAVTGSYGSPAAPVAARQHRWATGALALWVGMLFLLPAMATVWGGRELLVFDAFYRAGSLVFGGGHVVLPLLRTELVPPGWVGDDAFLSGYAAAQALPGPLFTFAGYLGTVIQGGSQAWLGGLWCLLAIFLPAWLLIGGALPFWSTVRNRAWTQAAMRGANAAVVGVLLAALYDPVAREGIGQGGDVVAVILAFAALEVWKVPAWLVVPLMAGAGQWVL